MIRNWFVALLGIAAIPAFLFAQAPATTQQHQHEQGTTQTQQAPATSQHQQMMQMHQKMMADMAAMDQKLADLVSQMNAAQGQAKVDAMAAVVSEMVSQQKQMHQHMASMMGPGGMMSGMMGGQQPGMMGTSGGMMSGGMMSGTMTTTFDPVCQARIASNTAPTATYQGKTYQFCSEADKQAFLKDPARYLGAAR